MKMMFSAGLIVVAVLDALPASAAVSVLTCHSTGVPNAGNAWILDLSRDAAGAVHAALGTAFYWHHQPTPQRSVTHSVVVEELRDTDGAQYETEGFSLIVADPYDISTGTVGYRSVSLSVSTALGGRPDGEIFCSNDDRL